MLLTKDVNVAVDPDGAIRMPVMSAWSNPVAGATGEVKPVFCIAMSSVPPVSVLICPDRFKAPVGPVVVSPTIPVMLNWPTVMGLTLISVVAPVITVPCAVASEMRNRNAALEQYRILQRIDPARATKLFNHIK